MFSVDDIERTAPVERVPAAGYSGNSRHRRRTRVLVVAFQVGKQADGGVESLTQLLERYDGLPVTVLSQAETAKNVRWRQAGARVLVWSAKTQTGERGLSRFLRRAWQHLLWNARAAWLSVNDGVEVAHVNDHFALWHVIAGLRLLGVPVIYNIRDTKTGFSKRDILKWRCAFHLTQSQIVLSREMREFWRHSLAIRGDDLIAIYSVVDFRRMHPATESERQELRTGLGLPRTFVAGYVASFSEKKAQLRFIVEAGRELKCRAPGIQIHFLGDFEPQTDAYAAACARVAREQALEGRFKFNGYTADVEKWYPALDVVIVATQNEGLARCMIESLACGTPVVSFDVSSAREILEAEDCGVVLSQGDYAGLVSALARLATRETERAAYGQRGAAVARRKFDPAGNTAQYLATYEALAAPGQVI